MTARRDIPTLAAAATLCAASLVAATGAQASGHDREIAYSVTVTNITKAIRFTPVLAASHTRAIALFELGQPASAPLADVAESGSTDALRGVLEESEAVAGVAASEGLLEPGASTTFTITTTRRARGFSLAAMLLPTNDSFVALDSVRLPLLRERQLPGRRLRRRQRAERRDLREHPRPDLRWRGALAGRLERGRVRARGQRHPRARGRLDRVERSRSGRPRLARRGGRGDDHPHPLSATRRVRATTERTRRAVLLPRPMPAPTPHRRRLLSIEDESEIVALLRLHLEDERTELAHAGDGADGLARALSERWDLILLDLGLPRCDGLDVCQQVRARHPLLPIIVVTARGTEGERVAGLEAGADDYVVKPFGIRELLARIDALLRRVERSRADSVPEVVVAGDVVLDPVRHEARIAGREVVLTAREFALLAHFAGEPGRVFRRDELLESVWGQTYRGYLHTVNTHINRLRRKIEPDPSSPRYIETVWGVGYRLSTSP